MSAWRHTLALLLQQMTAAHACSLQHHCAFWPFGRPYAKQAGLACKIVHSSASLHQAMLASCYIMIWLRLQTCLHQRATANHKTV